MESSSPGWPLQTEGGGTVVGPWRLLTKSGQNSRFEAQKQMIRKSSQQSFVTKTGRHNVKSSCLVVNLVTKTFLPDYLP